MIWIRPSLSSPRTLDMSPKMPLKTFWLTLTSFMTSLLNYLFGARDVPNLYFGKTIASVAIRKSEKAGDVEEITLQEFVERRCPSLHNVFSPAWWLPNGHFQTGYCVVGDFSRVDKVEYDRKLLRTRDGGTLGLDFTPAAAENRGPFTENTPVIVVLHGLTGGSHESYVRAILAPACAPVEQGGLGYRAVVVNFRGCAGVPLTSPQLYSAGHTGDIRTALLYISKLYPKAPLLGVGFSLGANVLTRYLAEEGEQSRLIAGCSLACPWDLVANSTRLRSTWWRRELYSKAMARNLTNVLRRHTKLFAAHPDREISKAVPRVMTMGRIGLYQFDDTITRLAGGSSPPFPMASAHDYYVWASSDNKLKDIRVPFLALNSEDDPIVTVLPVHIGTETLSPWVTFGVTKHGGHLAWFEEGSTSKHPKRWYRRPVLEWLKAMAEDYVVKEVKLKGIREVDGFLMEEGRDDIGCQVIEGTEHVVGVEGEGGLLAGL